MANGGHTEAEITAGGDEAAAAPEAQGNYKDGVYEGTGKGNNGDIKVEVKVEGGNITEMCIRDRAGTCDPHLCVDDHYGGALQGAGCYPVQV